MRIIKYLVVHCTATLQTATVENIQRYWRQNLHWKNPGYHIIVKPDGELIHLADAETICNGVAGHNSNSLHISYIGGVDAFGKPTDTRTPEQKAAIIRQLKMWRAMYPGAKILGHRDFSPDKNGNGKVDSWERIKECPCFDAIPEYAGI